MKNIYVEDRFVSGIEKGIITALVLDTYPSPAPIPLEHVMINNAVEVRFIKGKVVREEQLKKIPCKQFGFLTSDLLIDDVCNMYYHEKGSNHIYYVIFIERVQKTPKYGHYEVIPKFDIIPYARQISYSIDMYNPEYDEKPWRN